jgi:hypothetical protein
MFRGRRERLVVHRVIYPAGGDNVNANYNDSQSRLCDDKSFRSMHRAVCVFCQKGVRTTLPTPLACRHQIQLRVSLG